MSLPDVSDDYSSEDEGESEEEDHSGLANVDLAPIVIPALPTSDASRETLRGVSTQAIIHIFD